MQGTGDSFAAFHTAEQGLAEQAGKTGAMRILNPSAVLTL